MNKIIKTNIKNILTNTLKNKFNNYKPETSYMPFHTSLLGKDRIALFSFIQSLNTTFGTTIFEPVAKELAKNNFEIAETQINLTDKISEKAQIVINEIINDLTSAKNEANKKNEIEKIRIVANNGKINNKKFTKIDLFLKNNDEYFLFDIKTAKQNFGGFKEYKQTLLEWVAAILTEEPQAKINSFIAIPYNPYYPQPYTRWTMKGMLDLENELKVAEEFWNFLYPNSYNDLLDCFEEVGIEMRDEIDEYFKKFK
jgi:type II restriction enzyme